MNELLNNIIEGLARFGCGMVGLAYPPDYEEPTLKDDSEPTLYK